MRSDNSFNIIKVLLPIIEQEVNSIKAHLDSNEISKRENIDKLKNNLDRILKSFKTQNFSEDTGLDAEY